jgi:hypothetical protein
VGLKLAYVLPIFNNKNGTNDRDTGRRYHQADNDFLSLAGAFTGQHYTSIIYNTGKTKKGGISVLPVLACSLLISG